VGERLIRPAEVAEYLSVSIFHVYRMAREGELPHVKIGRAVRFRLSEITAWVEGKHAAAREALPPRPPPQCWEGGGKPVRQRRITGGVRGPGLASRTEWPEGHTPIYPEP